MEYLNAIQPLFDTMPSWVPILGVLLTLFVLGFTGAPLLMWAVAGAAALSGFGAPVWAWAVYGVLVVLFNVTPLRRALLSSSVMKTMEALQFLPTISETEQTAIDAGTVWMDAELFSGKPDFQKTLDQLYPELSDKEQAFLDNECEELCAMVDDWDIHQRGDLPAAAWDYLKEKRFFGMLIPEEHGGLGFSAEARSAVVQKLGTRSTPLSITVMVPNSLGPGELLLHYGTDAQKEHYLPKLANGDMIPAFALTEPNAGSDAGAMESRGEVFRGDDGELYVRAYNGRESSWFQAAIREGAGRIRAAGRTEEVAFEPADDRILERVDDAYREKYEGSRYLRPMISDRARAATVRVVPRETEV